MRVAIIGSAGRGDDFRKMNRDVFSDMKKFARRFIVRLAEANCASLDKIILVSGGSAWADHVAVHLFLESLTSETSFRGLELYLPCTVSIADGQLRFASTSAGTRLSELHRQFSVAVGMGLDSRMDLLCAKHVGAVLDCSSRSFQSRNSKVANVDALLAFTWNSTDGTPTKGGTGDTWTKCKSGVKYHVPLSSLAAELRLMESPPRMLTTGVCAKLV
jgi:hypothetical protein